MKRNFRMLGLALVAAFALSAVAASAAMAVTHDVVTQTGNPVDVTGSGTDHFFETNHPNGGPKVTCNDVNFSATVEDGDSSITVTPTYDDCDFGGLSADVVENNCHYLLTGTTDEDGHAPVDVQCGASPIEIKVTGCTVKVGSQTVTDGGVTYTKQGSGSTADVLITATATNVHYTKSGLFCGFVSGNGQDAFYSGTVTARGYVDGSDHGPEDQVGLSYSTTG